MKKLEDVLSDIILYDFSLQITPLKKIGMVEFNLSKETAGNIIKVHQKRFSEEDLQHVGLSLILQNLLVDAINTQ